MSLAGIDPDEAMSSTGEPTIFPSEAASSGGAVRDTAGFAGRGTASAGKAAAGGSGRGGGDGDVKSGAGGAGLAAATPSSVRRASAGVVLVARLSDAPHVTQKR
jgi:hypothetical protein